MAGPLFAQSVTPHFNKPPESNGLTKSVTGIIDNANNYVYLAVYSMNSKPVVNSLIDAHNNGVTVRVVTEKDNLDKGGSYSGFSSAYDKLKSKGITVKTDDQSALMHDKFLVVDDEVVLTGSTNLTTKQLNGDKNNMVEIRSSSVAYQYKQEFLEMWKGNFGNDKTNDPLKAHTVDNSTLTTAFSPKVDGTARILDVLNTADRNVFFNIFTFTHEPIADRMIALHKSGVNVRGTIDAWQADDSFYVKKIFDKLTGESVPVRRDNYNGLLHDKFMVIDGNTSSNPTLITGSYNWTSSADESNDENFVIIRDPEVVNRYYENARNTYLNHAVKPDWQAPLSDLVNMNEAGKSRLETLPGIGPATADAIVTYRSKHDPFRTVSDLTNVDGIGPATAEELEEYVTFGQYSGLVDINRATTEQLQSLSGIGPATAQDIVRYRKANGDFSSVDQLTNVSGIGSSTLKSIRDDIKATKTGPTLINVNTASADTLASLKGIGSVTASSMLSYRSNNGHFNSKDELTKVDGIGPDTLKMIRDRITVGNTGPDLINVNKADSTTLKTLSGIGVVTAQKIVAERTVSGEFSSVSGLTRVDGIGPATVDNIADSVTVGASNRININSAGKSTLETLSGIGPATAQAIIDYRNNNGKFSAKSQLKNVSGIGSVTYQLVRDKITI